MSPFYRMSSVLVFIAFLLCLIITVWAYVTHNQQLRYPFIALTGGLLVISVALGRKANKQSM